MLNFKQKKQDNQAKTTQSLNAVFNYDKPGINLNFTLKVSDGTQPEDFLELLKMAVDDVENLIRERDLGNVENHDG